MLKNNVDDTITLAEVVSNDVEKARLRIGSINVKMMAWFVVLLFLTYIVQEVHPLLKGGGLFYLYFAEGLLCYMAFTALWNYFKEKSSRKVTLMLDLKHLVSLLTLTDGVINSADKEGYSDIQIIVFKMRMSRISFS